MELERIHGRLTNIKRRGETPKAKDKQRKEKRKE